jgi:sulfur relay (sulfurtransferase) complex TusBCD TusD component (DsrE family)
MFKMLTRPCDCCKSSIDVGQENKFDVKRRKEAQVPLKHAVNLCDRCWHQRGYKQEQERLSDV